VQELRRICRLESDFCPIEVIMCSKISNFINDRKEKHVVLGYEEGWRRSFDIP
jgi:hypothetical protein